MNRRGFIGSILALGAAPAVVRSEILMPVRKIVVVDRAAEFEAVIRRKIAEIKADMESQIINNDLSDLIWEISPSETPLIGLPSGFRTRRHEWTIDILRPAPCVNPLHTP